MGYTLTLAGRGAPFEADIVTPMPRFEDWQDRLDAYITAHRTSRYELGRMDCCLFAAGAIEAMTGVDLAGDSRGRYITMGEARGAIQRACGRQSVAALARLTAERHRWASVPPLGAEPGDVALIEGGRGSRYALGIVAARIPHAQLPDVQHKAARIPEAGDAAGAGHPVTASGLEIAGMFPGHGLTWTPLQDAKQVWKIV